MCIHLSLYVHKRGACVQTYLHTELGFLLLIQEGKAILNSHSVKLHTSFRWPPCFTQLIHPSNNRGYFTSFQSWVFQSKVDQEEAQCTLTLSGSCWWRNKNFSMYGENSLLRLRLPCAPPKDPRPRCVWLGRQAAFRGSARHTKVFVLLPNPALTLCQLSLQKWITESIKSLYQVSF